MKSNKQRGFTIVELLVAMAVFQVILVGSLVAYLQISRFYQKSINAARLQQVSNTVVAEISRSIQNTGGLVSGNLFNAIDVQNGNQDKAASKTIGLSYTTTINGNTFKVLCVDVNRYLYRLDAVEPGSSATQAGQHVFMSDALPSAAACDPATNIFPINGTYRVILGENMSLKGFGVSQINGALYNVWMNAAYTSDVTDIDTTAYATDAAGIPLDNAYISCKGGSGRQFCAVSNVKTVATRRIGL